jgi:hypothetical protein
MELVIRMGLSRYLFFSLSSDGKNRYVQYNKHGASQLPVTPAHSIVEVPDSQPLRSHYLMRQMFWWSQKIKKKSRSIWTCNIGCDICRLPLTKLVADTVLPDNASECTTGQHRATADQREPTRELIIHHITHRFRLQCIASSRHSHTTNDNADLQQAQAL